MKNPYIIEKFWNCVQKSDGCWLWTKSTDRGGYGRVWTGLGNVLAHRFSWEIHHRQQIPNNLHVLHKCDTPKCVNPDHLWIGTHQDNMADMMSKRRHHEHWRLTRIRSLPEDISRKYFPTLSKDLHPLRNGKTLRCMEAIREFAEKFEMECGTRAALSATHLEASYWRSAQKLAQEMSEIQSQENPNRSTYA